MSRIGRRAWWGAWTAALILLAGCGASATPTPVPGTVKPPVPPSFPTPARSPTASEGHTPQPGPSPTAGRTQPVPASPVPSAAAQQPPLPHTPPPGAIPTPGVALPNAAALAALQRLAWAHQTSGGRVPGGCATLAGERLCVPAVAVDGRRLSDVSLIAQLITRKPGPVSLHEAIAAAVFQRLLYLEGRRAGIRATRAQARLLAEGELAAYQKDPSTRSLVPLPPGVTPQQYFLAPRTIGAYRVGMIVGRERDAVLRQGRGKAASVYAAWMQSVLPRHTVTVNGRSPEFSLPDALRAGYACNASGGATSC